MTRSRAAARGSRWLTTLFVALFSFGFAPAIEAAPTVTIITPGPGETLLSGPAEDFEALPSDPVEPIQRVDFIFPSPIGTLSDTTSPYEVTVDTNALPDGINVIQAVAFNTLGEASAPDVRVFTVDNSPPTPVTLVTPVFPPPPPGALTGTVGLSAVALDPESQIERVEFTVGGQLVHTAFTAPYSFNVDTSDPSIPDGNIVYRVEAFNNVGLSAFDEVTILTDNSPASTFLTLPVAEPLTGNIDMRIDTVDPHTTITLVEFMVDGIVKNFDPGGISPFTFTYDSVADNLPDGDHVFRGRVTNQVFLVAEETRTLRVDNSPPTVSMTQPSPGQVIRQNVTLTATATENVSPILRVEFYVDGVNLIGVDTDFPYSINISTAVFGGDGPHTVEARAINDANLTGNSQVVSVFVDDTAPAVSLDSPFGTPLAGTILVEGSAADPGGALASGLQNLTLRVDAQVIGSSASSPLIVPFDSLSPGLSDGNHVFQAVATDVAGNSTTDQRTLLVDNSAPNVGITEPAPTTILAGPFDIRTIIDEPHSGIAEVRFLVGGALQAIQVTPPFELLGFDPVAAAVSDGTTTIRVEADNTVPPVGGEITANGGPLTGFQDVLVTIDNSAPTVTLTSPTAGVLTGFTPMTADAADPHSGIDRVEFFIDGILMGTDSAGPPYSIQADTTVFSDLTNPHQFWAEAVNRAGLRTASTTSTLEIDNTAPDPVSVNFPVPGAADKGDIAVSVSATEPHSFVDRVELFVDGALYSTDFVGPPFDFIIDSDDPFIGLPDGPHNFFARAINGAELFTDTPLQTIIVDNSPPGAFLTNPSGSVGVRGLVTLAADGIDLDSGAEVARFFVDGSLVGTDVSTPPVSNFDATFDFDTTIPGPLTADGPHTFHVEIVNAASCVSTSAAVVTTIDNSVPTVALLEPTPGAAVQGTIPMTATAQDIHSGILQVDFLVDGISRQQVFGDIGTYETSFLTNQLSDGLHSFVARSTNGVGLTSTSIPATVVLVDNSPPNSLITAPTALQPITGAINVVADVSDNVSDVVLSEFFVDGSLFATSTTTPTATATFMTTTVTDGLHDLSVVATNGSGLQTTSPLVTVLVDNTPPTITMDAPTGGGVAGFVDFLSTPDDGPVGSGVDRVELIMDGSVLINDVSAPPWDISTDTLTIPDGPHTFFFRAFDVVGLSSDSSPIVSLVIDNTAPTAAMVSPTSGAFAGVIPVEASAADPHSGIAVVEFFVDGAPTTPATTTAVGPPYIANLDTVAVTSLLGNGTFSIEAQATNGSGLTFLSPPVTVILDNSAPVVALTSPSADPLTGSIAFTSFVTDVESGITQVEYLVDGTPVATSPVAPFTAAFDTSTLPDGSHTFAVQATNGTSLTALDSITVTVDNTPPAVSISAPTTGSILVGAFSLDGGASDPITGVSFIDWIVDPATGGPVTVAAISNPPGTFSSPFDPPNFPVSDGPATLTLLAEDGAGLQATAVVTFTIENSGPVMAVTTPGPSPVPGTFDFQVSATEPHTSVSLIEYFIDGVLVGSTVPPTDTIPVDATPGGLNLNDGPHQFHAVGTNVVGLQTTSTTNVVVVDQSAPTVTITDPAANQGIAGVAAPVAATADDPHSGIFQVEYLLDAIDPPGPGTEVAVGTVSPFGSTIDTTPFPDGNYFLQARATNGAGLTSLSATVAVTVDNSAPAVLLTTPTAGPYSGSVEFGANATDPHSLVTQVEFFVGGVPVGVDTTFPYLVTADTSVLPIPDGTNLVEAVATNGSGLTSTSAASVVFDNSAPALALTSPVAGPLARTLDLTATSTDPHTAVVSVEFLVDGLVVGTDATAPYLLSAFDTTTLTDGPRNFQARSANAAGREALTPATAFVVDNSPPVVTVVSPVTSFMTGFEAFEVAAVEPHTQVVDVAFLLDAVPIGSDPAAPYATGIDTTLFADGPHVLEATATNSTAYSATATLAVVFDNSPPTVSLVTPDAADFTDTPQMLAPSARAEAAAENLAGTIWVAGGADAFGTAVGTLEGFIPALNSWTTGPPMPNPRAAAASGVVNGRLVVAGGRIFPNSQLQVVEAFDPAGPSWATLPSMASARERAAGAGVEGRLYVFGGLQGAATVLGTGEVFDEATNAWSALPPMITPRYGAAAVVFGNQIWVVGGHTGAATTGAVEVYDTVAGAWSSRPVLPTPDQDLALHIVGTKLIAYGGAAGLIQAYDFTLGTWSLLGAMPAPATSGAAWASEDPAGYLLGGFDPAVTNAARRFDFPRHRILTGTQLLQSNPADPHTPITLVEYLVDAVLATSETTAPFDSGLDTALYPDGYYDLAVRSTNAVGLTSESAPAEFFFQNSAPAVTLTTPNSSSGAICCTVAFDVTASDLILVTQVEILVNGSPVAADLAEPFEFSIDTTTIGTSGFVDFQARATNLAGLTATTPSLVLIVDNTPPAPVTLSAPVGPFVSGTVTFDVAAVDPESGIQRVDFLVDLGLVGTDTLPATYTSVYDTTVLTDGPHDFAGRAFNFAGLSTTVSSTIVVDNSPPTAALTAPNSGPLTGSIPMTGTASDPHSGISQMLFLVDGVLVGSDVIPPYSAVFNSTAPPPGLTPFADGLHNFQATALNGAGGATTTAITSYVVDNSPPSVTYDAPLSGPLAGPLTLQGTGVDPHSGVALYQFSVGGVLTTAPGAGPNFTAVFDPVAAALPDGLTPIFSQALNGVGQLAVATTVFVELDNTGPGLSNFLPFDDPFFAPPFEYLQDLEVTAADPNGVQRVEFLIDSTLLAQDFTAPYQLTGFDTRAFANGTYTFRARAFDTLGNMSEITRVQAIDNPGPPDLSLSGSLVVASPLNQIADGASVVTVEVFIRDSAGRDIPEQSPSLASDRPAQDNVVVITPTTGPGLPYSPIPNPAVFQVTTVRPGAATYTATLGGLPLADTAAVTWLNVAPTAVAAAPSPVDPSLVTLDGSGSSDVNGDPLTHTWTYAAGPVVANPVNDASANATVLLTAPGTYTFQLAVSDGIAPPSVVTTAVAVNDLPPAAIAGPDLTVQLGTPATLDGSASFDPNGTAVSFSAPGAGWTQTAGPAAGTLAPVNVAQPTLTYALGGIYRYQLVVSDGVNLSAPDEVIVLVQDPANQFPIADAGLDQTVTQGVTVQLNGGGSVDPDDGTIIAYDWSEALGNPAVLGLIDIVNPSFTASTPGTYRFELAVTDIDGNTSLPDEVTVTVQNPVDGVPTACIEMSPTVPVAGQLVTFDASCSADPEGAALNFTWDLITPVNSPGVSTAPTFVYTPLQAGPYHLRLTVTDGTFPVTRDFFFQVQAPGNNAPTLDPAFTDDQGGSSTGGGGNSTIGAVVTLTANANDADADPLTYIWTQAAGPAALLSGVNLASPTFTAAVAGTHHFRVFVSDGSTTSVGEVFVVVNSATNSVPVAVQTAVSNGVAGQFVVLNGVGSFDPDGSPITHGWYQVSGPAVNLINSGSSSPSFSPQVAGTYVFRHVVSDGTLTSPPGFATVIVQAATGGGPPPPGATPPPGAPVVGDGGGDGGGGGCASGARGEFEGLAFLLFFLLGLLRVAARQPARARR